MAFQTVFQRYELKYMLTREQKAAVLGAALPNMELDKYGRTTIRNLYFDTDNYRLVRRSLEKPEYKEKLRIRSYSQASADSVVFVELKKKYKDIVYKRRMSLAEKEAMSWVCGGKACPKQTQIAAEIDYFMEFYGTLKPAVYLSYEREAYFERDGGDMRITFDDNILCRQEELSLCSDVWGTKLLPDNMILMELKCSDCIPLWMIQILSGQKIYKTSFSKYGRAYQQFIYPKIRFFYPNIREVAEYAMA